MATSETLLERVKRHEGFCQYPKPDKQFKGTAFVIGYGHDIAATDLSQWSTGITQNQALGLLQDDLDRCAAAVNNTLPWAMAMDPVRYGLILEMVFQMGMTDVLKFKHMLAACQQKDWETAADEMLASAWHQQTPGRCEELAALMISGGAS